VSPEALCLEVDQLARCVPGCATDDDCYPTWSCTGSSGGEMFCERNDTIDPFACQIDDDCQGLGRCFDGRCGCTSDADCPPDAACPAPT
jgi:hypothetical protein